VAPLAALRDVAVDRSGSSTTRAVVGVVVLAAGVGFVLLGVTGDSDSVLTWTGLGSVLMIFGLVILGPVVARPTSLVLGAPLPRVRGFIGALARRNAVRNPRRTAATASALMIGVAVVSLFTVFAQSLKVSFEQSVNQSFGGDLVVGESGFGFAPLSLDLAPALSELPEVDTAVGFGGGAATVGQVDRAVSVADVPAVDRVLDIGVQQGAAADVVGPTFAVSEEVADNRNWRVGTPVTVEFPDGSEQVLTVAAIYEHADVAGGYLLPRDLWIEHAPQAFDFTVLVALAEGVSVEEGRAAVEEVADGFGAPAVQDREEFLGSVAQGVDFMLNLIYVMLALAIFIALMGIANTLSLSVYERTRELGLLRAVGETRRQVRSMVRWESVIVAVFGTLGGLGLGLFLGWALVEAASAAEDGLAVFSVPVVRLLVVLVVGGLAGALAGIRPARRAARLDVLDAIATE
jgi:putative ABC transport system permease protein